MTLLRVLVVVMLALTLALMVRTISGPSPPPVSLYGDVDRGVSRIAATPAPASRRQHVVVQFERAPTASERRRIEAQAFVRFVASVPRNAYVVGFATQRRDEVDAALTHVAPRVVRFIALNKLNRISPVFAPTPWRGRSHGIVISHVPEDAKPTATTGAEVSIQVRVFSDVPRADALQILQRYGSPKAVTEGLWGLEVTKAQIDALAGEDSVQFISPYPGEPTNDLDQARQILNIDTGVSETGAGVTIAQREGGHPAPHDAFKQRLTISDPLIGSLTPAEITHATKVAGILAGDGAGDPLYHGVATSVNLRAYSSRSVINADLQYQDAVSASPPASIANNSWGDAIEADHFHLSPLAYTELARFYDVLSSGRDEIGDIRGPGGRLLVVGSAGNLGEKKPWGTARIGNSAKNAIAVGNVANQRAQTEAPFAAFNSSRGPTSEGRITPTLVAPGGEIDPEGLHNIRTTSAAPLRYGEGGGTSFSAPMVAGAAALLTERIRNSCRRQPAPTDLRALLIHTAIDLTDASWDADAKSKVVGSTHGHSATADYVGPDFVFGWGLADIQSAIAASGQYVNGTIECGGSIEYRIVLDTPQESAAASPLKVTLAWDDPPYAVNAAPAADTGVLQNDLDLELVAPDGRRFLPWHLDATNPAAPATRASYAASKSPDDSLRDHRNTIEQVVIDAADRQSGEWRIRVRANRMQIGPQSFTLVSDVFAPTACGQFPQGAIVRSDRALDAPSDLVQLIVVVLVVVTLIAFLIQQGKLGIGSILLLLLWLASVSLGLLYELYWVVVLLAITIIVVAIRRATRQKV